MRNLLVIIALLLPTTVFSQDLERHERAYNLVYEACHLYEHDMASCLSRFEERYKFNKKAGLAGLQRNCDGGESPHARGCFYAGVADDTFFPEQNSLDNSPAFTSYFTACENGYLLGCTKVYERYIQLDDPELQIQAQIRLQSNCYKGETLSCRMLGQGLSDPRWESLYNLRSMSAAYNQDCLQGNKFACSILGHQFNGNFSEEDNTKIQIDMLGKTCGGGVTMDCLALGQKFEMGARVEVDLERARSAYQQGCGQESETAALACSALGALYSNNSDLSDALNNAERAWKSACYKSLFDDCERLIQSIEARGEGGQNLMNDVANFADDCNAKNGLGCFLTGQIYLFDNETAPHKDPGVALEYFQRSCELHTAHGCSAYAKLAKEEDLDDDMQIGRTLKYGCDLGDPEACKSLDKATFFESEPNG